jgi:hypothetical protein
LPGWNKQNFIGIKEPSPNDEILEIDGIRIDKKILKDDYIMIPLFNIFKLEKDGLGSKIGKKLIESNNDISVLTQDEIQKRL